MTQHQTKHIKQVEHELVHTFLVDEETAQEIVESEIQWLTNESDVGATPRELARVLIDEYEVGEDSTPELNDQRMRDTHPISGNLNR